MNPETLAALERAQRLATLGVEVRSDELAQNAKQLREFQERGGNRAMRRAAARMEKSGVARTPRAGAGKVR